MSCKVIQMLDHVGVCCSGQDQLAEWLDAWSKHLIAGAEGELRTVVVLIERADGSMSKITQSIAQPTDRMRLVGFLHDAAYRALAGELRELGISV